MVLGLITMIFGNIPPKIFVFQKDSRGFYYCVNNKIQKFPQYIQSIFRIFVAKAYIYLGTRRRKVTEPAARIPADSVGGNHTAEKYKSGRCHLTRFFRQKSENLMTGLVPLSSARAGMFIYLHQLP
jgi:hypothetical protein